MCWSADGSLKTYLFGMILAAVHKYQGDLDPSVWLLMTVFTHMQLVEYFLWKNLNVPAANRLWSGAGAALLFIQPLISATLLKSNLRNKLWITYVLGAVSYFATRKVDMTTEIGGNGHLKWNWITSFASPWALAWLLMLVGPMWITGHEFAAAFIVATYLVSAYFNDKYGTAGSYWCWFSISTWMLSFDWPRLVSQLV
jgi:hypothetical protein